jgi:hypothetical protein
VRKPAKRPECTDGVTCLDEYPMRCEYCDTTVCDCIAGRFENDDVDGPEFILVCWDCAE